MIRGPDHLELQLALQVIQHQSQAQRLQNTTVLSRLVPVHMTLFRLPENKVRPEVQPLSIAGRLHLLETQMIPMPQTSVLHSQGIWMPSTKDSSLRPSIRSIEHRPAHLPSIFPDHPEARST
jgi:hypothetical protein